MRIDHLLAAGAARLSASVQRDAGRVWTRFRFDVWFPHVPLAIAVGLLGALRLLQAFERSLGVPLAWESFDGALSSVTMRGLPQVVTGMFLIVMSVGLLLRSQLAWVTALLVLLASLSIAFATGAEADHPVVGVFNGLLLLALLLGRRRFRYTSLTAATLFAVISIASLLVYAVVGSYELGQGFEPPIEDFVTALYFSVVSMATVGYGDVVPQTAEARLFTLSIIVIGISVFATSLSALLMPIVTRRMLGVLHTRGDEMTRANHYIIVGDTALARNTYQELQQRKLPVTIILPRAPIDGQFTGTDVVTGDASDLDVLRRAGADRAQAVLALGGDDSENAFVILAVKDLPGSAKTVAVVNDAKNTSRVNRVQPDLIFSLQVVGGELLAMALSGEMIHGHDLLNSLLRFRE